MFALAVALGALLAALVPWFAGRAEAWQAGALAGGAGGPVFLAVRAAVVMLACFVPSFALGASLPAAVRALAPSRRHAGPLLNLLYAANTIGAVAGVFLATGYAFEALGNRGTVWIASAAQVGLALAAVACLGRRVSALEPATTVKAVAIPAPGRTGASPRLAAFLCGFAGIVVEVAWIRRLAPALGTTAYAFGTVLGAYLLATALGAACFGPHRAREAGRRPALVLLAAAFPAALLAPAVLPASAWAAERLFDSDGTASSLLWIRAAAAGFVLVPSVILGAAGLPWLVQAADPSPERTGTGSGAVLGSNTVGSAVGALAAGLLWLPAAGSAAVLRGAGALYAGAACLAATGPRLRLACGAVAGAFLVASVLPLGDDAGRDAHGATFDPGGTDPAAAPAVWFREGRVSTVVVRDRDGRPELWVDGKVVASASPTDRLHLALLGHLPMCLHPAPRRAAVVGLGTGITSTAVAAHGPEVLDVFELEDAVREAAERFRVVGGGLPPGASFHAGDGRDGLLRSAVRYDVITSDPIHPAVAGSAGLYTLEHYRLLASRLSDDGLACQWLPLYELEADDIRTVLRTFSRVFRVAVFVAGPDLVLVGSRHAFAIDPEVLARRMGTAEGDALRALGLGTPGRLLGLLLADPDRTMRFAGRDGPLNTDDRLVLEFTSARSQYTGSSVANLRLLAVAPSPPATLLAPGHAGDAEFAAGAERTKRLRRALADWMEGGRALDRAATSFDALARDDPADRFAPRMRAEARARLADVFLAEGGPEGADEAARLARAVLADPGAEVLQRLDAAEVLLAAGFAEEARAAGRAALAEAPTSARARRLAGG